MSACLFTQWNDLNMKKKSFFKVNSANNDRRQHESNNNTVFSWQIIIFCSLSNNYATRAE